MELPGGAASAVSSFAPGVVFCIAIPIVTGTGTTVSTTVIPANAKIVRTVVDVTLAWASGTILVRKTGGGTLQATTANNPKLVGQYDQPQIQAFGAGAATVEVVRNALVDGAGAGAAVAYIFFCTPFP